MLAETWTLLDVERCGQPAALAGDWTDLVSRALVPAGLNAPQFLCPLFTHLKSAELAVVRSDGQMVMALPVSRRRAPPALLANWVTPLSVSGLPHLDRNLGQAALDAFLRREAAPVMLTGIPADGPFWDALQAAAPRLTILDRWERAAVKPTGTFEDWFESNIDRKRRKEYRRLRTRLSEQGKLECRSLKPGEDVEPWSSALLDLEARGWKGARGTALKSTASLATAFAEICRGLHDAGKLRFWSLVLDGRPIASLFAVVEGSSAWLGKIAHDETFAKFSPGVLLILDVTEAFFAEGNITSVDSCAIPNHPMIDHLWRDRLAMADVLVAAANVGQRRFQLTAAAELLRRRTRSQARDLYYALTRRHRS